MLDNILIKLLMAPSFVLNSSLVLKINNKLK